MKENPVSLNIEEIKRLIIERLMPLSPEKVLLFGSYAWGTPDKDSDIDLYVVTKDDFIPQSYAERWEIKKKVYEALRDIRLTVPVDIIVHTREMHKRFIELNSSFSRELLKKGIVLYGER